MAEREEYNAASQRFALETDRLLAEYGWTFIPGTGWRNAALEAMELAQ